MTKFREPYQDEWKVEFDNLEGILKKIPGGYAAGIQHAGSTAIPGLFA